MRVVIIKYNAGNVLSVTHALRRLGLEPELTDDSQRICSADKVIFPGVGEAASAMAYLKERKMDAVIASLTQPVLGICLGLQLMCRFSEERNTECLGIFERQVRRFEPKAKVPHTGWNNIEACQGALFKGLSESAYVYFVHSYYAELGENTAAVTDYITPFSSALHRDNFYAVQFHPEKSGDVGESILRNFIEQV